MIRIGYACSSEEHPPNDLVRYAARAESLGFSFVSISDHFHPWTRKQGHSPFVWSVIGGIATATKKIGLGTGVTCPIVRIHPAVIAHAAATSAAMMPGRFYLGLGAGENLNEHILGLKWPAPDERLERLREAIDLIRQLWEGSEVTYRGKYYTVEDATIFDLPPDPPPIMVAAKGPKATVLAATEGDGLIATSPDSEQIEIFEGNGGVGKPRYGMLHVCWGPDEKQARRTALEIWPNGGLKGELGAELPLPRHFEQATASLREEDMSDTIAGPDPGPHIDAINEYVEAGFDHVYVHQVGPDQEGFFSFYEKEVLPKFR